MRSDPTKNKEWKGYAASMGKKSVHKLNRKKIKSEYNKGIDKKNIS